MISNVQTQIDFRFNQVLLFSDESTYAVNSHTLDCISELVRPP